jgi:hypothetical protein
VRAKLYLGWTILKLLFAVVISPPIALTFFISKRAFLAVMGALWPHLDIFTPEGELYLRRWFFWPKFKHGPRPRFLHLILVSDTGRDGHDHPGRFDTTILWNGYDEEIYFPRKPIGLTGLGRPGHPLVRHVRAWNTYSNPEVHTHRVKLVGPTLSWVVGWKKGRPWGFWILHPTDPSQDRWVESEEYGEKGEERRSWTNGK